MLPRAALELLEGRRLLSTFNVLNLTDHDPGSLRAAISAAEANPGADVIQFSPQLQGTITLTTGELLISTDLAINGPGANRIAISGNDASRIFHVAGGAGGAGAIAVSVSGLKIVNGQADRGGGIMQEGSGELTLSQVRIANNVAHFGGGGIRTLGGSARLNISNSIIADNRLESMAGFVVHGGGVLIDGATAQINNSVITGNHVIGLPGGGIATGGGMGNLRGATSTITGSIVSNNRALGGSDGGEAAGGGISNATGSKLYVVKSTVSGNAARGADGESIGQAIGGGIVNAFGSSATISDSVITGNRAIAGSGGFNDQDDSSVATAFGGAIVGDVYLEINRCIIAANQAIGGSNGTHIAPVGADVGAAHGGGIIVGFGGDTIIRDTAIINNKAIGGDGNSGSGPMAFVGTATGGGIDHSADPLLFGEPSDPPRLTLINTALVGNEAIGGNNNTGSGGTVLAGAGLGGGLANYLGGIADLSGSLLSGNKATGGSGGLAAGGGIFNGLSVVQTGDGPISVPSIVRVSKSAIVFNTARGGAGSAGGDGLGGGAYNDADSTLALQGSIVTNNLAIGGPVGGKGIGGGVYNAGVFTFDTSSVIHDNHASTSDDDIFG